MLQYLGSGLFLSCEDQQFGAKFGSTWQINKQDGFSGGMIPFLSLSGGDNGVLRVVAILKEPIKVEL